MYINKLLEHWLDFLPQNHRLYQHVYNHYLIAIDEAESTQVVEPLSDDDRLLLWYMGLSVVPLTDELHVREAVYYYWDKRLPVRLVSTNKGKMMYDQVMFEQALRLNEAYPHELIKIPRYLNMLPYSQANIMYGKIEGASFEYRTRDDIKKQLTEEISNG